MDHGIPTSYVVARSDLLEAAAAAGARVRHDRHPRPGLEGEELFVDVAEVGPVDSEDLIVVVSGTHGVEGYLGSALQRRHLRGLAGAGDASAPAIAFVHALNPFGFSWVRRVNEDNVDLNRNFLDWSLPAPTNHAYDDLAGTLVPDDWSEGTQERTLLELLGHAERMGMPALQQAVSGGQWAHPTGLFFGGTGPAWSNRWLRGFLADRLRGVRRAAVIDLHTGLGPWGHGELISSEALDAPAYERQQAWWGEVTNLQDGSSVSAELSGEWLGAVPAACPDTEITGVALEYGTVDPITVVQALRADAVLHAHGDPTAPGAAEVRAQVRAAFIDDDPAWFDACAARYDQVLQQAALALTSTGPSTPPAAEVSRPSPPACGP